MHYKTSAGTLDNKKHIFYGTVEELEELEEPSIIKLNSYQFGCNVLLYNLHI